MVSLKAVFRQRLEADAALTTILTGGIWDSSELPRTKITAKNRPEIFEANNITIKPFAAITWREGSPLEMLIPDSQRRTCEVYIYQQTGYDKIDAVLRRLEQMFEDYADRQLATADDAAGAWVRWIGGMGESRDENLQNASMNRARFEVTTKRT
jgi:hypothetical protein